MMKQIITCVENQRTSLDEAIREYIITKQSEGIRPATIEGYSKVLKLFFAYCSELNICTIHQISKEMIEQYKIYLLDKELKLEARNSYLRIVRCFINYLISSDQISHFKINLFPPQSKLKVSVYSDEELKKLFCNKFASSKNFSERRDYVMTATLLLTGIRRGTLRAILIEDIDFLDDRICLRHIKRDSQSTIRQIPLNPELKPILEKYIKVTNLNRYTKFLFPNVEGQSMGADTINHRLKIYFEKCGVKFRGCHEFRRTFATKAFKELEDLNAVQKLMMISDSRVLQRYINEDFSLMQSYSQKLNFISQIKSTKILKGNFNK